MWQIFDQFLQEDGTVVTSQQNHDVNSLNRDTIEFADQKAQFVVNIMCDFNNTLRTEENFLNLWKRGPSPDEELINSVFKEKWKHE